MPRVSVICTTYNCADTVAESVQSILGQSFDDFEFVVVDDGSNDETHEIIRSFNDPRIKFHCPGRLGRAKALNHAVQLCQTDLIANIDSDDLAEKDRLKLQFEHMESNPRLGVLGTAHYQMYESGTKVLRRYPASDNECRQALATYGPFCHSSVMYRAQALKDIGGFDESLPRRIDLDAWIRIAAEGYELGNLDEILTSHRKNDNTFFVKQFSEWEHAKSMLACNKKAIRLLKLPKRKYITAYARVFWRFLPNWMRNSLRPFASKVRDEEVH